MPALTKRFIDSLKPTSKEQIFYDPALIGFGIRVRPNGRKAYLVRYRNAEGLHKKLILGYHGELTPTTARALAQKNLAEIHDGADPVTAKKERREAPTVADLGQRYLDFHAVKLKPASREAAARALRLYILPAIGKKKVADVQRVDIERLQFLSPPRTIKKDSRPVRSIVRWSASGLRPPLPALLPPPEPPKKDSQSDVLPPVRPWPLDTPPLWRRHHPPREAPVRPQAVQPCQRPSTRRL